MRTGEPGAFAPGRMLSTLRVWCAARCDARHSGSARWMWIATLIACWFVPGVTGAQPRRITLPADDPAGIVVPTGSPELDAAWANYLRLWRRIGAEPDAATPRRLLGLPLDGERDDRVTRPTRSPRGLRLPRRHLIRVQTPLLIVDSTASPTDTLLVAKHLHRVHWAWTQLFFPLWRSARSVQIAIGGGIDDEQIGHRRISRGSPMRVVLLRDASEYRSVLSAVDGIERSTGYYDPAARRSYFYVGDDVDGRRARQHEWVHQLFAEATDREASTRRRPVGRDSDFWLIEGIAGYFESFDRIADRREVLGGWDCSRLQYARLRRAVGQSPTSLAVLRPMGRIAAQASSDLAGWYNDSILWTHALMSDATGRQWLLGRLAEMYDVQTGLDDSGDPPRVDVTEFLKVDDAMMVADPSPRRLTDLCLAGCGIGDQAMASVGQWSELRWSELRWLDVAGCPLTDASMVPVLSAATKLEELDVTQTRITDRSIDAIGSRILRVLFATGTGISDASIDRLSNLPRLQTLDVQATEVSLPEVKRLRENRPGLDVNARVIRQP